MNKIKVLLVDDHQIFRDGIMSMFNDLNDIELLEVIGDPWEALGKIDRLSPDVLVLDLSMPGLSGIELLERLRNRELSVNTLILSMHTQTEFVTQAMNAGAKGYLPKQDTTRQELVKAIREVALGKEYMHESIRKILDYEAKDDEKLKSAPDRRDIALLSPRETEVLKMVVEGLSNQEIANELDVNIRTVETHKTNILQKLDLKNSVELVKFAIRNKLMEI